MICQGSGCWDDQNPGGSWNAAWPGQVGWIPDLGCKPQSRTWRMLIGSRPDRRRRNGPRLFRQVRVSHPCKPAKGHPCETRFRPAPQRPRCWPRAARRRVRRDGRRGHGQHCQRGHRQHHQASRAHRHHGRAVRRLPAMADRLAWQVRKPLTGL